MRRLTKFLRDDEGAVSLEYALIGAMLSIMIAAGADSIGSSIKNLFFGPVGNALTP